ncbi:PHD-finger domain-containing protein [Besnoitia besnoiti]|uniref:PHD-finger domain-containing protein n=1 Tax=Besnoitia besnoiti TaxID=94643 RepID=A0A2A9M6S7_BESBE|nr:PHD-finger domain-containing protein [Besnoitia besnoiti]PFH32011.1 PHD-finger domain-containing protein [Besnoitia besnoiti]
METTPAEDAEATQAVLCAPNAAPFLESPRSVPADSRTSAPAAAAISSSKRRSISPDDYTAASSPGSLSSSPCTSSCSSSSYPSPSPPAAASSPPSPSSARTSSNTGSVAVALPHPPQLPLLKAAAVRRHLLKARKAKLRHAHLAKKIARRFPDINKVWGDLSIDLDDDGTRCDICGNYDSLPGHDEILFCDGCDVAVHQTCYCVASVPDADWYCQYCENKNRAKENVNKLRRLAGKTAAKTSDKLKVERALRAEIDRLEKEKQPICVLPKRCPLCPRSFGAHVRCGEGSQAWIHVHCAVWLPEAWITRVDDSGGLLDMPAWRFEKTCDICGVDEGAVINCFVENCPAVFHPICAAFAGYGLNLTGQIDFQRKNDSSYHAFCLRHRGYTYRESVDADEPIEYLFRHPDASHPFFRAANLVRRNRDIIFFAKQCHQENSTWGLRMGAYLIKELNENLVALRALWQRISALCTPAAPLCSSAGMSAETTKNAPSSVTEGAAADGKHAEDGGVCTPRGAAASSASGHTPTSPPAKNGEEEATTPLKEN